MNKEENETVSRSNALQSIRPVLNLEKIEESNQEKFQNEVLRPILKFQNDLLLSQFQNSKQFKQQLERVDRSNKITFENGIRDFLKSNNAFRNKCYGLIIALMTVEEHHIYSNDESEYNRRIIGMLLKRVVSQL